MEQGKSGKLGGLLLLALVATAYTIASSDLESQFLLKSCLVLLPVQVGACGWLFYRYWTGQIAGTERAEKTKGDRLNL